jgi:hypothetical protein
LTANGGLCTEVDDPYTSGLDGTVPACPTSPICDVMQGSAPVDYTYVGNTTLDFESAVTQQPISVAIHIDKNFKVLCFVFNFDLFGYVSSIPLSSSTHIRLLLNLSN